VDQLLPTPGLANLRVEMEAIAQLVYLNHAAMAPMPRRVHESMARYLAGRRQFGDFDFDEEFERVSNGLGEGLAQLISPHRRRSASSRTRAMG
jgi:selenocysteine lyase/cysteine desulfurase